jgi:exopolyphosphatase/pppGpp-phosphohydrolase
VLHEALQQWHLFRSSPGPCVTVLGSAGTTGALAFIRRRSRAPPSMSRASAALREMNLARRQRAPGIEERRAEIIVACSVILEEICAHLGARTVRVVRRGLRDGLMLEEIERLGLCQPLQPDASRQRMSWSDHSRQSRRRATLSITCTASRTASDDRLHMSIDQR